MDNSRFYSKQEYFSELIRRFDNAGPGSRIMLFSMTFNPAEPMIAAVMNSLESAATRGAEVTLGIDARSFLVHDNKLGPLWYHADLPARCNGPFRAKQKTIDILNYYPNARAVILNRPGIPLSLPVAGRSHIKLAIIDNYMIISGCNLDEPSQVDLAIGWQNQQIASELSAVMKAAAENGTVRRAFAGQDKTIAVDDDTTLYIDAGRRGQSLILDRALMLIDSAEEWLTITCQFFPNSITAQHLLAAKKRGVKVEILFANRRHHGAVGGAGQLFSETLERSRLPADMFQGDLGRDGPMLHAKLIACDKGFMLGSHNYVRAGVRLGTAEIALASTDAERAAEAVAAIHASLAARQESQS